MKSEFAAAIPAAWRGTSRVFAALGDEHRQRILLLFESGERLNVAQIAGAGTLARSTVAHHLKTLRDSGVLLSEKVGREVYFWIDKALLADSLRRVLDYLEQHA